MKMNPNSLVGGKHFFMWLLLFFLTEVFIHFCYFLFICFYLERVRYLLTKSGLCNMNGQVYNLIFFVNV